MRRPKSTAVIAVNLRFDADLVGRLETAAKGRVTTLSQEVRGRLITSFTEPSLPSLLADFKNRARDTVEAAGKKDIESAWRCLQKVDAECARFNTAVETLLFDYVHDPKVRDLLRGAPALPEHKPSQQERGRGGKK